MRKGIIAEGTVSSDGKSLTATTVSVLPAGAAGNHGGWFHGTPGSFGSSKPTA